MCDDPAARTKPMWMEKGVKVYVNAMSEGLRDHFCAGHLRGRLERLLGKLSRPRPWNILGVLRALRQLLGSPEGSLVLADIYREHIALAFETYHGRPPTAEELDDRVACAAGIPRGMF